MIHLMFWWMKEWMEEEKAEKAVREGGVKPRPPKRMGRERWSSWLLSRGFSRKVLTKMVLKADST